VKKNKNIFRVIIYIYIYAYIADCSQIYPICLSQTNQTQAGSNYGSSIVLSKDGKYLAFTQPANDNPGAAGLLHILSLVQGGELQRTTLLNPTPPSWPNPSGQGITIAGNDSLSIIAIAIPLMNVVQIYQSSDQTSWSIMQTITAEFGTSYTGSNIAMSRDGNILIIGEPGASSDTGQVTIYNRSGSNFILSDTISGAAIGDQTGYCVSLDQSGIYLAIGEPGANSNFGRIRAFKYNQVDNTWDSMGATNGSSVGGIGSIGQSLAINYSNGNLIVAAIGDLYSFPSLLFYTITNTGFNLTGFDTSYGLYSYYGTSLAFNDQGTMLAVGQPGYSPLFPNNTFPTASVIIHNLNAGQISSSSTLSNVLSFGYSLALNSDGSLLIASAPFQSSSNGVVFLYQLCPSQTSEVRHIQPAPTSASTPTHAGRHLNINAQTNALLAIQNYRTYTFPTTK
jgi:hypothetical protein